MARRSFSIRPGTITFALAIWLGVEVLAFALVVSRIGLTGAVLVGLASSVLGFAMLRRVGVNAVRSLRRSVQGSEPTPGGMLDGSLAALGSVLLILPGFVSDLVGLALAAPSVRQWLAHRFGAVAKPGHAAIRARKATIDLAPGDWRAVGEIESSVPDRDAKTRGR